MKVGIVVPYSWSFWGGVVEHAEAQAQALGELGVETRLLIGHDPPGSLSRVLHPRQGRPGPPPAEVIPLGRSVIVPGNGALSNLVISPSTLPRLRRALARERFDVLHVHEP
ncbi:MAG: glycosyltransferase, partial [Gaiellaceae bacterium]